MSLTNYSQLPVYKETHDLLLLTYQRLKNVPRDMKYSILADIQSSLVQILICIYQASTSTYKAEALAKARSNMDEVKVRFRLLCDMHAIGKTLFAEICQHEESISKQLGAWFNKSNAKR